MNKRINRVQYNFSRQTNKSEFFKIDRYGNYVFRKGLYSHIPMKMLYDNYGENLFDLLLEHFDEAGIIDKKIILEIIKELEKQ